MSNLKALQQSIQNYLLENASDAIELIQKPQNDSIKERLDIYHNAYYARLTEVLEADFVALKALLGTTKFTKMAEDYIKAFPSKYFSVNPFGKELANFLATTPPYNHDRELAEVANLEWALTQSLEKANAKRLTIEDLQQIAEQQWPNLVFKLHPSVHIITCYWNCLAIWIAVQDKQDIPASRMLDEPQTLLIWRKDQQVHYYQTETYEAIALKAIQHGKTFASLCQQLCEFLPEEQATNKVVSLLMLWIQRGILQAL